jgi:hypothetical protein
MKPAANRAAGFLVIDNHAENMLIVHTVYHTYNINHTSKFISAIISALSTSKVFPVLVDLKLLTFITKTLMNSESL